MGGFMLIITIITRLRSCDHSGRIYYFFWKKSDCAPSQDVQYCIVGNRFVNSLQFLPCPPVVIFINIQPIHCKQNAISFYFILLWYSVVLQCSKYRKMRQATCTPNPQYFPNMCHDGEQSNSSATNSHIIRESLSTLSEYKPITIAPQIILWSHKHVVQK